MTRSATANDFEITLPSLVNFAFELRTPLNAIIGFSETIANETFGPIDEKYRGYAKDIHRIALLMWSDINDVMDAAKLQAGKMEMSEESIDIAEVVQHALQMVEQRSKERTVTLRWFPGVTKLPNLYCDRQGLSKTLQHVLSDAMDHNKPGSQVKFSTTLSPTGLTFIIEHTGIYSPDLKLTIARGIMELHGGRLAIKSASNVGTTICLSFPSERVIHDAE